MQISRHWRLKPQRYRLIGFKYANGAVSVQARPNPTANDNNGHLPTHNGRYKREVAVAMPVAP
jgi:hypothetical protein